MRIVLLISYMVAATGLSACGYATKVGQTVDGAVHDGIAHLGKGG